MGFLFTRRKPEPVRQQTMMLTHEVGGRELPLAIVENARAKRLTLRLQPGARGLKVTVPPGVPQRDVSDFLARHEGWLQSKLILVPDHPVLREGMKVPVRGKPHRIVHMAGRGVTALSEDENGPVITVHGDIRFVSRRISDFLKREARREIEALVEHHTKKVGRRAKAVRFKDTTSRWGSCTSEGNLSFSWRIMMAPPTVINYLVAHECAHLREMNHGPKFWKLCEELCPDTPRAKAWLKKNGSKLQAIGF